MPADSGSLDVSPLRRIDDDKYEPAKDERKAHRFGSPGPLGSDLVERVLQLPPGYDRQLAYAMAVISGWSYAHIRTLGNKLKYYGLPGVTIDRIAVTNPAMSIVSTAFFVRSACGRIGVLSFRGTEPSNIVNWLTDTDTVPRRFGNGKVHRGFYANVQAVWEDIESKLRESFVVDGDSNGKPRQPMQQLYITGHSLGAAMAVLAAAKIWKDGDARVREALRGIYTYGQPAVGDAAFVKEFEPHIGRMLFRHAYGFDVVPYLPPLTTGDYRHFGSVRIATRADEAWVEPNLPRQQARDLVLTIATCFASYVGRRIPPINRLEAHIFKYSFFDDHSPTNYIETSRAALRGD